MKPFLRTVFARAMFGMLLINVACNTTRGVGADIENAGEGLKNSAGRNGAD